MRIALSVVLGIASCAAGVSYAADHQIDDLQKELSDLRNRLNTQPQVATQASSVDRVLDERCGCEGPQPVVTKCGKFRFGLLNQEWFTAYQKDNRGLFDGAGTSPLVDTNETQDNSSFRCRRTEMYFNYDLDEHINSFINYDPDREVTSYPFVPDNTANQSCFKRLNLVAPEFDAANGPKLGNTSVVSGVQSGGGSVERSLKDAWINYHGEVPHTDFTVGLIKHRLGEEGLRNPGELDFAERGYVGFIVDDLQRELGAMVHQTWWDDRFQYWLGVWDGAGNYLVSESAQHNRADDNQSKDFNYRVLVRPLWNELSASHCSCGSWAGRMELGMSSKFGRHGDNGSPDPVANPLNSLNRRENFAIFHDAWFYYAFNGPLCGWWVRGEYGYIKDRNPPGAIADDTGSGGSSAGNAQSNPHPFVSQGGYASTGYRLSQSVFADCLPSLLKPMEFAARYDSFDNVEVANETDPDRTDVYKTPIITGGINYYIKGHNAKIQADFNTCRQPDGGPHNFHKVKNDSFILAFQVYYP